MTFCPFCGTKLTEGAAFCVECGKKLPVLNEAQQPTAQQPTAQQPAAQQPTAQQPTAPVAQAAPVVQAAAPVSTSASVVTAATAGVASAAVKAVRPRPAKYIALGLVFVLVAAIVTFAAMYFLKSDEQKITERVEDFSEAISDMDMEDMMECFDKRTRKTYEVTIGLTEGILGGITGFDLPLGDLIELGGLQYGGEYDVNIQIKKIEINGNSATVYVSMNDGTKTEEDEMIMCKEGNDWYIDYEATTGEPMFDFDY